MEENNNFNLESGLSFYLFVMGLANLGPLSWIRGYLKNKPFGMQTLFDKVSISFTYAAQACQISFCLVIGIGLLIRPVNVTLAEILGLWDYLMTLLLFTSYLSLTIVRYLSIFHSSTFLEQFDDDTIEITRRLAILVLVLPLVLSEHLDSGGRDGFVFEILTETTVLHNDRSPMFGLIVLANVLMTVLSYARIEYDNFKLKLRELQHVQDASFVRFLQSKICTLDSLSRRQSLAEGGEGGQGTETQYDPLTLRIVALMLLINVGLVLINVFYTKFGLMVVMVISVNMFFCTVLVPVIIIHWHPGMTAYSYQSLRRMLLLQTM